jgi:hypothetical protein
MTELIMYKKTLAALIISIGFVVGCRDDHRNSAFDPTRDKICAINKPYSVPDGGSTLGFLAMSLMGFACWRMKH